MSDYTPNMTDEELAIAVGRKLLKYKYEVAVLHSLLENLVLPDSSRYAWRDDFNSTMAIHLELYENDAQLLREAVANQEAEFPLMRLCNYLEANRILKITLPGDDLK